MSRCLGSCPFALKNYPMLCIAVADVLLFRTFPASGSHHHQPKMWGYDFSCSAKIRTSQ